MSAKKKSKVLSVSLGLTEEMFWESQEKQCSSQECSFCAKIFYAWLQARITQMELPFPGKKMKSGYFKPACKTTFAEAAATSVKPERK